MSDAQPLYAKVKDHILTNIRSGAWEPGRRVPSENELVESFGISRMTANRALRELTAEGFLNRVPGVGTFVREAPALSSLMELRNIAEEIAQRGHRYSSRLVAKKEIDSNPALGEEFEDRALKRLFHIVMVHEENGVPVQLELLRGVTHDFIKMGRALREAHDALAAAAAAIQEAAQR